MKNKVLIILLSLNSYFLQISLFSQSNIYHQNITFRDSTYLDTTTDEFKEIFSFWNDYKIAQYQYMTKFQDTFFINKYLSYWYDNEKDVDNNPDLCASMLFWGYLLYNETFIGISKRNDTLFELQTVLYNKMDIHQNEQFAGVLNLPIVKIEGQYKLVNKLSINKFKYEKYNINELTFFFPKTYDFNKKKAKSTYSRIKEIASGLGVIHIPTVECYLFNDITELFHNMGVDGCYADYSFYYSDVVTSFGFKLNNCKILYTKDGEGYSHEILHILLHILRGTDRHSTFDEGFCTFFGGAQCKTFDFHSKRLKLFLNDNRHIDLSRNLLEGFVDKKGNYINDTIGVDNSSDDYVKDYYHDHVTNFTYTIQAVICDILYKKGGMPLVKQMLMNTNNDDLLYPMIEKYLSIKQDNFNEFIRNYINENY